MSGGYPGLAAIWAEERQRRSMLNIDLPLTPPLSPGVCCVCVLVSNEEKFLSEISQIDVHNLTILLKKD